MNRSRVLVEVESLEHLSHLHKEDLSIGLHLTQVIFVGVVVSSQLIKEGVLVTRQSQKEF